MTCRNWPALHAVALAAGLCLLGCGGGGGEERAGPGEGRHPRFAKGKGAGGPQEESRVPVVVTTAARGDMQAFLDASSTLEAEASVDVVSQATGVVAESSPKRATGSARAAAGPAGLRGTGTGRAPCPVRVRTAAGQLRPGRETDKEQLIAEEDFQQIKFDLARAEIDWQQASLDLEHTRILAPISGTVTERMINVWPPGQRKRRRLPDG